MNADDIKSSPVHSLAYLAMLLDPFNSPPAIHEYNSGSDENILFSALLVLRKFPRAYIKVIKVIREIDGSWLDDEHFDHLEYLISDEMEAEGFPHMNLDDVAFGAIPMFSFAVDWSWHSKDSESRYYSVNHKHADALAKNLGIEDECPSETARFKLVCDYLTSAEDPRWVDVSAAIQWLLGFSGNTLVDYTEDDMSGIEPYYFINGDDLAHAREVIDDANSIMQAVARGLSFLNDNPDEMERLRNLHEGKIEWWGGSNEDDQ